MEDQLAPAITESQLNVLEYLTTKNCLKPSDFTDVLKTTPAAVTTLLDRMEKNDLIKRTRDEKDRRIVWVKATEKGLRECERGSSIRSGMIQSHLDRISSHNQQLLIYLLSKVANS